MKMRKLVLIDEHDSAVENVNPYILEEDKAIEEAAIRFTADMLDPDDYDATDNFTWATDQFVKETEDGIWRPYLILETVYDFRRRIKFIEA